MTQAAFGEERVAEWVDALRGVVPEATTLYLYGSTASGEAGPHSDIDLAVLAPAPIELKRLAAPARSSRSSPVGTWTWSISCVPPP